MKELWSILLEKLKQVEPTVAAVIIGVCGLFTIGMTTVVTSKFFTMIIKIVEVVGQTDVSKKGF
jgi:hypothetical protein